MIKKIDGRINENTLEESRRLQGTFGFDKIITKNDFK